MLTLFERAALRAGWRAARAGVPFHENPFARGALARFARQWGCGWAAANDYVRPFGFYDWERSGGALADLAREAA
ncbi:hypothetical protein WL21_08825 [Burkholderia ubonensis]|uniref:hypothetical protein n=1 Tax=Burkholderia ubonensis TaxID=101571 RepID=UPI0007592B4A|nr:hypothetical protein [Burkholderia ubonensis]KVO82419.1 hypothetical protein WJ81_24265 [Burkholderia ubonensis]KVZ70663.1 hypothetical protein WL20_32950 [Burkholderia ubonensis]KVZ70827.1 hypothetical protein WL21_08825 [Burkholderia ubonensis]